MEFSSVKSEHILKAVEDFKLKGFPDGFGPSSTYDVIIEEKKYGISKIIFLTF